VGSAFIVNPYLSNLNESDKKKAVKKITLYAFCICSVSLFAGHYILELFGISIPVIQLAGGIMICKMGWEFLSANNNKQDEVSKDETASINVSEYKQLEDKLFYPITFPVTTGAGTMSVLFTLSAHSSANDLKNYLFNTGAILLAIVVMCILVYVFYLNTKRIINYLG
jgi:multiple antibiotic resistance protein